MVKKKGPSFAKIVVICLIIYFVSNFISFVSQDGNESNHTVRNDKVFRILASTSTEKMDDNIIKYASKNGIKVEIDHYGDLEMVDMLNDDSSNYDAVWISNSLWLYTLSNSYLVTDSKSIVINPVVMGITKSKAKELGFVDKEIYNKDLLNAIKDGKLKYIMASVTKTNTGATSYLSFLNSLAGSPEVLTEKMLDDENLRKDLKSFFKGVERVSGDEEYLSEMFKNGNYNAMISYESSLIELNQELVKNGKEPLYLIYPVDGVAINDMPFAYINNDSDNTKKKEEFNKIQSYLRSDDAIKIMEDYGYRSWYGGINNKVDKKVFNPDWGIDTTKYLKDMKYPSKAVISKAINLYIESLRKPTHVVFCLDVSGSMYGEGLDELKEAMNYILDYETASKDNLQFSSEDKINIIAFDSKVQSVSKTSFGNQTDEVIKEVNKLRAYGGTNIYDPSIEALKILKESDSNDYTKTVILMTDGRSNAGYYANLKKYYDSNKETTPIYSITFGDAYEKELSRLATLSNGKVFNGKNGLKKAFAEVRSYN